MGFPSGACREVYGILLPLGGYLPYESIAKHLMVNLELLVVNGNKHRLWSKEEEGQTGTHWIPQHLSVTIFSHKDHQTIMAATAPPLPNSFSQLYPGRRF